MMLHSLPSILLVVLFVNDNFSLDLRITLFGEKMFLIKLNYKNWHYSNHRLTKYMISSKHCKSSESIQKIS